MTDILNINFNGSFTDISPSTHSLTVSGAFIDTNNKGKFAAGQYMSTPDGTDFSFGNDDFEFDIKVTPNGAGANAIFTQYSDPSNFYELSYGSTLRFLAKSVGNTVVDISGGTLTVGTEAALAVKKVGGVISIWKDGVQVAAGNMIGSFPNPTGSLYFGYGFYTTGYSINWNGWFDDILFTRSPVQPQAYVWNDGKILVSETASKGPNIFISTLDGQTYATLTMASMQAGTKIPTSYHEIDVTQYGLPSTTKAVQMTGLLICTMGTANEIGELRVYLGDGVDGNYIAQAEAVPASQGFREPFSSWADVDNGILKFAWWCSSPQPFDYPNHAAFILNMNLQAAVVAI